MNSKCIKYDLVTNSTENRKAEYRVEFEDGAKGRTMSSFTVGQSYDYVVEERTSPQGKYNYIKKPDSGKFGGGGYKKDRVGLIITTGMSYVKELIVMDIFRGMRFEEISDAIINPMLVSEKAMLTDREKDFVSYCMSYAIDIYKQESVRDMYFKLLKITDTANVKVHLNLIVMIYNQLLATCLKVNKNVDAITGVVPKAN